MPTGLQLCNKHNEISYDDDDDDDDDDNHSGARSDEVGTDADVAGT